MPTDVPLPALGESVTEGTVTVWLKQVGDHVELEEPLLEISTDKVDTEVQSPVAGTLIEIRAQEDETVEVGAILAVIGDPDETPSESHRTTIASPVEPTSAPPERSGDATRRTYHTPLVRKLAKDLNVDLSALDGSGEGRRIRKADVMAAAASRPDTPPVPPTAPPAPALTHAAKPTEPVNAVAGRTEKLSRLRRTIASRMVESLQTAAQLTTVVEVDMTAVAIIRRTHNKSFTDREGVSLSYLPFIARAALEGLDALPQVNATVDMDAGTITYPSGKHLGIAVDTERGLIVPVIRDAGDLNVTGLARRIAGAAKRTRDNTIPVDELSGGTFTITNTGSRGALFDTPIINLPQSAILGTGAVVERPVVVTSERGEKSIAIRSMAYLALTYDHRVIDGADAARYLGIVKRRLEAGQFEADVSGR